MERDPDCQGLSVRLVNQRKASVLRVKITRAGKPFGKKVKSSLREYLTLPMTVLMGAVADMVCKLNFGNRIPF